MLLIGAAVLGDSTAACIARVALDESWWLAAEHSYRIASEPYHHDLRARADAVTRWGSRNYRVVTNSLGFKDSSKREVALRPSVPRILFIGDSFTEGVGFEYHETFVGIIDTQLRRKGIEVLNAAVVSYSPSIYYRKVRHLLEESGVAFDHLVVMLDLSDIEDEAELYRLDEFDVVVAEADRGVPIIPSPIANRFWRGDPPTGRARLKQLLRDNSIALRLVGVVRNELAQRPSPELLAAERDADDWIRRARARNPDFGWRHGWNRSKVARSLLACRPRGSWTMDAEPLRTSAARGLEEAAEVMDRLRRLLGERRIGMSLVVYPWPEQLYRRDLDSKQVAFWGRWSGEGGVRFINLFPPFVDDGDTLEMLLDAYIPGDVHFSAGGHRRVAEALLSAEIAASARARD